MVASFVGYAGAGTNVVNISGTGRVAGDLLILTAVGGGVGGGPDTKPTGWRYGSSDYVSGADHRQTFYKISDGTEGNVTVTGAGAVACSVYRGVNRIIPLGIAADGSLTTLAGLDGFTEDQILYAYTQNSSAGSPITAAPAPVNLRGVSAAGAFYIAGIADEAPVAGVIPQRVFTGGSGGTKLHTLGLYQSAKPHIFLKVDPIPGSSFDPAGKPRLHFNTAAAAVAAKELILASYHWKGIGAGPQEATRIPADPAGYSLLAGPVYSGNVNSNGNPGQGSVATKLYKRIADGTEGANIDPVPVNFGFGLGLVMRFASDVDVTWKTDTAFGADVTVADAAISVVGDKTLDCAVEDKILIELTMQGATFPGLTSPVVTIPGCSISEPLIYPSFTQGIDPDLSILRLLVTILNGAPTGAPTISGGYTATVSGAVATFTSISATSSFPISGHLTNTDLAMLNLGAGVSNKSRNQVMRDFWSGLSGLAPAASYSLTDHMSAALAIAGFTTGSISDRYRAWLDTKSLTDPNGKSNSDKEFDWLGGM